MFSLELYYLFLKTLKLALFFCTVYLGLSFIILGFVYDNIQSTIRSHLNCCSIICCFILYSKFRSLEQMLFVVVRLENSDVFKLYIDFNLKISNWYIIQFSSLIFYLMSEPIFILGTCICFLIYPSIAFHISCLIWEQSTDSIYTK